MADEKKEAVVFSPGSGDAKMVTVPTPAASGTVETVQKDTEKVVEAVSTVAADTAKAAEAVVQDASKVEAAAKVVDTTAKKIEADAKTFELPAVNNRLLFPLDLTSIEVMILKAVVDGKELIGEAAQQLPLLGKKIELSVAQHLAPIEGGLHSLKGSKDPQDVAKVPDMQAALDEIKTVHAAVKGPEEASKGA